MLKIVHMMLEYGRAEIIMPSFSTRARSSALERPPKILLNTHFDIDAPPLTFPRDTPENRTETISGINS